MRESLLLASLILFAIALVLFILDYFMFHHLGKDLKFHKEKKALPEKPFITNLMGMLATLLLGASIVILVLALVAF